MPMPCGWWECGRWRSSEDANVAGAKCAGGSQGPDPVRPGGHSRRSGLDLKGHGEPLQV